MLSASDRRILVLILILAVLSGFLIATADTGLNDPLEQEQKFLSDPEQDRYIQLGNSNTQYLPNRDYMTTLNPYRVRLAWQENPGLFEVRPYGGDEKLRPEETFLEQLAVPPDAKSVRVEVYVSGLYEGKLSVGLAQFDEELDRVSYEIADTDLPFTMGVFAGAESARLFAFTYTRNTHAEYFNIGLTIEPAMDDGNVQIGYIDMNWETE